MYKGNITPTTNLIQTVGIGTTVAYVTGVRPFFNAKNENNVSTEFQKNIVIVNNVERLAAAATAIVSAAGTISSVAISTGGRGYDSAPTVTIQILLVLEQHLVQKQPHLLQTVSSQV